MAEVKLPRERGESVEEDWLRKEEPTSTPTLTLRGRAPSVPALAFLASALTAPVYPAPSSSDVKMWRVEEEGVRGGFRGAW